MAMMKNFIDNFPKIMLFGDSLTQFSFAPDGFGAAIADHFQRKCDVLNRGFSGYTTRSDKLILPRLLQNDNHPKGSVIAATILLGSNDSEDTCFDKSRNVPEKEYRENLKNICHQFNNAGVSFDRQVLITPPAVDDRKWEKHCKTKGDTIIAMRYEFVKPYAKACLEIGQELGIEVFDLWTQMQKVENWNEMLSDGLHLSAEGNKFVSKGLVPILDRKLSDLSMVFPNWNDVHPTEPHKQLGIYNS